MISAGKNVLIEKPLTTDLNQARDLEWLSRDIGQKYMVNFQLRFNPGYMEVKEAIVDGQTGDPFTGCAQISDAIDVATTWFDWSAQSRPHWFLFQHTMDVMRRYLQAEPTEVIATGDVGVMAAKGIDTFDTIQPRVRFGDAFVTFETSWIGPSSAPSVVDCYLSLYGTNGKAKLDADYNGLATASDTFRYPWAPAGHWSVHGRLDHPLYYPIKYFVDAVIDDFTPSASLFNGLVNVAMISATDESARTGKAVSIDVGDLVTI